MKFTITNVSRQMNPNGIGELHIKCHASAFNISAQIIVVQPIKDIAPIPNDLEEICAKKIKALFEGEA